MNFSWFWARLRSMTFQEVRWRAKQLLRERLEKFLPPPRADLSLGVPQGLGLPRANLNSGYIEKAACLEAAEKILDGVVSIFNLTDISEGVPIPWHLDHQSGKEAPRVYSKDINYRSFEECGDIKYVWEPSRHLELVTLARAFALTGDSRFREGFKSRLNSWLSANPFNQGVHWCSALEVGIRLGNWAICADFFGRQSGGLEGLGEDFLSDWKQAAFEHCHYIRHHVAAGSSANNHLVGELAGLFLGCSAFPFFPQSMDWRNWAQAALESESELQIYSDGVNKEQTTGYHPFIADFFLIPGIVAEGLGTPFSVSYWDRLEAMANFSASLIDVAGNVPFVGDLDDGHVTRLCDTPDFHPHLSLVATMSVIRARPTLRAKAKSLDEKTYWLTGEEGLTAWENLIGPADGPLPRAFPKGGYWLMGRKWDSPEEVKLIFDCGPLGFLSLAAHGHADALSIQLSVAGKEILVDPGNWCYFQEPAWRDYFKGTLAHNTLQVDGLDQSSSAGMFLWRDKARSSLLSSEVSKEGGFSRLAGEHDGYKRLADSVVHRREIEGDSESVFLIRDSVVATEAHNYSLAFHFSEQCEIEKEGLQFIVSNGPVRVCFSPPAGWDARIVKGQEDPPLGWRATRFMVRNPSPVLLLQRSEEGDWESLSKFEITHLS